MLQFEELRLELNDNKQKLSELREALGLDALKEEIAKLEEQTAAEEFGAISKIHRRCSRE